MLSFSPNCLYKWTWNRVCAQFVCYASQNTGKYVEKNGAAHMRKLLAWDL